MADSPRHSVSVAAVVVDDHNRVLLIRRRDNGHWEPPGGVLELDEEVVDGLRREVAEETGIQVEPVALTGVYKNMARGIVALVFRCRQLAGLATTADETAEFRWVARGEVLDLADPAYAIRVLDALDSASPPAVRAHDGVRLV